MLLEYENMLVPSSKGWINKYFDLVEKNQIKLTYERSAEMEETAFIHASLARTGIIFGFPNQLLFAQKMDSTKWTAEEKLKILLFESLLLVYSLNTKGKKVDKKEFSQALTDFYGFHGSSAIKKIFTFFVKETEEEKIEAIFSKRVDIKINFLENRLWVNYFNNVLIYLDVILFYDFLTNRSKSTLLNYDEMAMNTLTAISLACMSDGIINSNEKNLFSVFLASANLSDLQRDIAEVRFQKGADFSDFTEQVVSNELLKLFLVDLASFVVFSNYDQSKGELSFLQILSKHIGVSDSQLNVGLTLTEQFILNNQEDIPFLKSSSSVEKVYSSLSKRWIKILGRNKDKLATELKQSKELVSLIRKSTMTELSKEEKETVKSQFMDIVKSMPSLAIFMLPGGAFLLPLVLKVIPDLIPSAFRDNEVEK